MEPLIRPIATWMNDHENFMIVTTWLTLMTTWIAFASWKVCKKGWDGDYILGTFLMLILSTAGANFWQAVVIIGSFIGAAAIVTSSFVALIKFLANRCRAWQERKWRQERDEYDRQQQREREEHDRKWKEEREAALTKASKMVDLAK